MPLAARLSGDGGGGREDDADHGLQRQRITWLVVGWQSGKVADAFRTDAVRNWSRGSRFLIMSAPFYTKFAMSRVEFVAECSLVEGMIRSDYESKFYLLSVTYLGV